MAPVSVRTPAPCLTRAPPPTAELTVRSLAMVASLATLNVVDPARVRLPPEIKEVWCALFALELMLPVGVRAMPDVIFTCPPLRVREPRLVAAPTLRAPSELMVTAEVGEIWSA